MLTIVHNKFLCNVFLPLSCPCTEGKKCRVISFFHINEVLHPADTVLARMLVVRYLCIYRWGEFDLFLSQLPGGWNCLIVRKSEWPLLCSEEMASVHARLSIRTLKNNDRRFCRYNSYCFQLYLRMYKCR